MVVAYVGAPRANLIASGVFMLLLTLTYAVSSASHAVSAPRRKYLWRAWDQGVIYLLIVGTYTPFWSNFAPQTLMAPTLALVWCAALVGFVSKVVYHWRVDERFSAVSYVALGWVPALGMCYYVPWDCLQWIALGGVLYTVGVPFLTFDKRVPYFHTVWHFSVITASACHFYAVCRFVLA
jgi:hemolysin III